MKKVSIIGLFRMGIDAADGQSIKTRTVAQEIEKTFGPQQVHKIDTYGWKKRPWRLFLNCVRAVCNSANVVFLTDAGGVKVFSWLLTCANFFFRRTVHYVVVGGWLVHYVQNHRLLVHFLKKLDGIYVETQVMQRGMESLGFKNVYLMPNFKDLVPLKEQQLSCSASEPYRFCIFSRIMKEKGIAFAVEAVQSINRSYGRKVCTLDLYGQIDSNQKEWFDCLRETFSDAVQYCGVVPFDKSVDVLKEYDALLFPTQFYTEGNPGTIIDAYAAGIPIIASEWESVGDILDPGLTGISYPFDQPERLQECMIRFIENPEQVYEMKKHCLKKAEQYLPDAVMEILLSRLV